MARIYVVDNGGQWTHREWRVLKYLDVESEIVPNDTPWEKLQDLDGLVLSGGAPRVGLQHALGKVPEFGKMEMILDDPTGGRILAGLPERSIVWESHNDEVVEVPKGFRVTAHSASCPVQAIEHEVLPRFGLQFHPEVEHTQHGERIFRNFIQACRK